MHDRNLPVGLERRGEKELNGFVLEALPCRRERDPLPIRGERRMRIVARRSRQALETSTVGADSIDLVVAVTLAGEGDPIPPRRPRRKRVEVRAGLELPHCSRGDIEKVEMPL